MATGPFRSGYLAIGCENAAIRQLPRMHGVKYPISKSGDKTHRFHDSLLVALRIAGRRPAGRQRGASIRDGRFGVMYHLCKHTYSE